MEKEIQRTLRVRVEPIDYGDLLPEDASLQDLRRLLRNRARIAAEYGNLILSAYFADLGRALRFLDTYEDVGGEYRRGIVWAETPEGRFPAWVYMYPDLEAVRRAGGVELREGRWRGALPKEP